MYNLEELREYHTPSTREELREKVNEPRISCKFRNKPSSEQVNPSKDIENEWN
jgi:hypothetical protein